MFAQLDSEMWLAKRLEEHGTHVFTGLTTTAERKARFRAAIETVGPSVVAGRGRNGKPETYGQVFERLFREPLSQPATVPATGTAQPSGPSAPAATGSGR